METENMNEHVSKTVASVLLTPNFNDPFFN